MAAAKIKSVDAARASLERFAELGAAIAYAEAKRQKIVARADAAIDAIVAPLKAEQAEIAAAVEPWWTGAAADLTKGKRKSIDLGGCAIGTRTEREFVAFTGGDDKAALAAVLATDFKAKVTEVRRVLDKGAIADLLKGKSAVGVSLKALGFAMAGGGETFFIKRVDNPGAKVSAQ
jgi:hypothetical protein